MRQALFSVSILLAFAAPPVLAKEHDHAAPSAAIAEAVASPQRKPVNRLRDKYRHPAETLAFFGVAPDDTVVEIWPGGGWYAEILAPLLRDKGLYYGATEPIGKPREATEALLASDPQRFGKVRLTVLTPGAPSEIAPPGSADFVLTFRNVHNLQMAGDGVAAQAFADFYKALKPGGVLGIVDHRLPEAADRARERTSGYVKRSTVVRFAQAAGFKLVGESEINANPKDTTDWPDGVWTLPPALELGDKDRARYLAIGESDRMTFKFVKPK